MLHLGIGKAESKSQEMISKHCTVQNYLDSIKDAKEVLTDPNKDLTAAEIRLGMGKNKKVLNKKEKQDEKILLGNLYKDKEFLR